MTDLRTLERDSIVQFVTQAALDGYLSGRVLDYGCGKQPYRGIVEAAGGEYVGFDVADFPANVSGEDIGDASTHGEYQKWDTILCTQVVQYVPIEQDTDMGDGLQGMLAWLCGLLQWYDPDSEPTRLIEKRGHLVMTYPTNWPEVEPEDLHRFTKAGMERLLMEAGFTIVRHEMRAGVRTVDFNLKHQVAYFPDVFALGYGVIARA